MKSRPSPFLASALTVSLALPAFADTSIPWGLNNIDTTGNPVLGVITRDPGGIAWFNTAGNATASGTTLSNGIIGPWAFIGTGTNTRYATLDGSNNVVGYTGAIAVSTFGWTNTNPDTYNYDVSGIGGALGFNRTANTVRYTGATGNLSVGNVTLTLKGLMNVGSGTLTISRSSSGTLRIGSTQELVLNAANAGISISAPIVNNSAGASAVTITGPSGVTLSGSNTYTGGTTIASGSLTITGGTLGSGDLHVASGATFNINASQTISQTVIGSGAITTTKSTTLSGDFSGFSGTYTHSATATGDSTAFTSTSAASKNAAYSITTAQSNNQGLILGGPAGNNIFEMGSLSGVAGSMVRNSTSVTDTNTLRIGNLDTDTEFAGTIAKSVGGGTIALEKVGDGNLTLSGTNTYTGATTVTGGKLTINGNISTSNLTTVKAGATLGGNGTLGITEIEEDGIFAPGNSAGTLTLAGNLTLESGSLSNFEINGFTTGNYDLAVAAAAGTQNVAFNGILNLLFQPGFNTTGSVKIFDFDGYSGSFPTINSTGLASGFTANFNSTTGVVTVVPEPSAALLGSLGMLMLLRRRS